MGFNCGIVGLPNVGKSTLFNALTATQAAESANFPFCTIEPNVGRIAIKDERLYELAKLAHSEKIIPAQMEFVDIAGLVRGASKGEGLGNQFLANIREVDVICHVVRCFEDQDIGHVEGVIDPLRDLEIIETELMLADLDSLERRLQTIVKKTRAGDKDAIAQEALMKIAHEVLSDGKPARKAEIRDEDRKLFNQLHLITAKPHFYVANLAENEITTGNHHSQKLADYATAHGVPMVAISAQIESDIAQLESDEDRALFLEDLGLTKAGLDLVVKAGFQLLGLINFFTVGPKEARAWTVPNGANAPQAAGEIHTDFMRGFIAAETIHCDDYLTLGSESAAKDAGKLRLEGRDYIVKDGDVFHFRFNV